MKKILILLGSVVFLFIIILLLAYFNLNTIVEQGIKQVGPEITKTSVGLDKAKISLFSGQGKLYNFVIGNPKGFSSPYLFKVKEFELDLEPLSLLKDLIVIEKIYIDSPSFTYELKGKQDNLKTFINNMEKGKEKEVKEEVKEETKEKSVESKSEKSILIKELVIKKANVDVVLADFGQQKSQVLIDEIRLTNLGGKGKSAKDVMARISEEIINKVIPGIGPAVKQLTEKLNKVGEQVKENLEALKKGNLNQEKVEQQVKDFKKDFKPEELEGQFKNFLPGQKQ